jgi:hypothetical protein
VSIAGTMGAMTIASVAHAVLALALVLVPRRRV